MRGSLLLTLILSCLSCCCQELSYRQFTVKDGLPGAIVYQSLQDRNGFIWFATNQGVSRFDGRTFRNFSKEDGLPDNEIVKLYLDKHNNVWFISLMGIPSVFYHDSIIRIDSCSWINSICEDGLTDGIVMVQFKSTGGEQGYYQSVNRPGQWKFVFHSCAIMARTDFFVLRSSAAEKINVYFSGTGGDSIQKLVVKSLYKESHYQFRAITNHTWLSFGWPQFSSISSDQKGVFFIGTDSLYYADIHQLLPLLCLKDIGLDERLNNDFSSLFSENDSTLWICSRNRGLLRIRYPLSRDRVIQTYFPKSFCTSLIKDREGGYWITTHSDGVYYLPNLSFYSVSGFPDLAAQSVLCIRALDSGKVAAGFSDGNVMLIDHRQLNSSILPGLVAQKKNNRIMDIGPWGTQELLLGTDGGLYRVQKNGNRKRILTLAIKEFYASSDSTMMVAAHDGVFLASADGELKRKIMLARATCVTGWNETYCYWGSLQGLYLTRGDSTTNLGKRIPALAGVINHIDIAPDSSVWVSTGQGIVILKDGGTLQLTREQGLPSNLCKHISFNDSTCWVSTDKGLCRIDYRWDHGHLVHTTSNITEEDGLTANDVNQTVAAGKYIWAATARGISFFSKDYVSHSALLPLINITRIVADNSALALKDTLSLGPQKTRLLIELSGISFRSGREISYEYRLKGLDSSWRHITNSSIEFPALPFGTYTLEVSAIDRWGKKSDSPRMIYIRHSPPFWLTTWFILSSYLLMALAAGAGVYIFHRYRRQKREKDYQLNKRMQDLEMMALRAQMNPHFIFNCLSSIQYHIMNADVKNASAYLHKFSTLIRQTLQNSTASMILLRDEIKLLQLYLDLEKLRLGDRMEYRVEVSPELDPDRQQIPTMIVQPYVENAVKHGISPLEGVKGILLVGFKKVDNGICCTIEDNGPGIDASGYNAPGENGHQSMGRSITEKRIHTFNALQKEKIHILITDKRSSGYPTCGTLIQLFFPISST
ncbi:histidine kinase [Flavitalea sp. BT771]|uniref:sensor histidine kinase n=1 Tax=Flavitalea sp. BT771 TaxID=3063329 RepID=UPI0026E2D90F|nr:histidine kinase [Flavitalea sp. BT771]MDO6435167.1 histidine kinase [Flavitalea sp. BT771]MDV6224128.1 histidine kinase [Flavitalea sp. BT771]